jgi:transcriptional regulator with XRE-family HTH domain
MPNYARPNAPNSNRTPTEQALGRELRRLRRSRGLSQRALTKQLGLSAHSNIADYESGRRIPPRDIVLECERVLGSNTLSPLLEDALAARALASSPKQRNWPYVALGAAALIAVAVTWWWSRPCARPTA